MCVEATFQCQLFLFLFFFKYCVQKMQAHTLTCTSTYIVMCLQTIFLDKGNKNTKVFPASAQTRSPVFVFVIT
jgi:hypothetical protein